MITKPAGLLLSVVFCLLGLHAVNAEESARPNVLFIAVDDLKLGGPSGAQ